MRIYIALITSIFCSLSHAASSDIIDRLAEKYSLHDIHEYRAAINTREFAKNQSFEQSAWRASDDYQITALLLGYKPIMLVDTPQSCIACLSQDSDLMELQRETSLYYAEVPLAQNTTEPLIYRADSRHSALCFLKYMILEQVDHRFALHTCPENIAAHCYMMGVLLGYPEEDIALFFQRSAFIDKYGKIPEYNEQAKEAFYTFLKEEWPYEGALSFHTAQSQVKAWLAQQGTQTELEAEINALSHRYPELHIRYDQPFQNFINRYATEWRNKVHTIYDKLIWFLFVVYHKLISFMHTFSIHINTIKPDTHLLGIYS